MSHPAYKPPPPPPPRVFFFAQDLLRGGGGGGGVFAGHYDNITPRVLDSSSPPGDITLHQEHIRKNGRLRKSIAVILHLCLSHISWHCVAIAPVSRLCEGRRIEFLFHSLVILHFICISPLTCAALAGPDGLSEETLREAILTLETKVQLRVLVPLREAILALLK